MKTQNTLTDNPENPLSWTLCFAIRSSDSIIDLCHPTTKRSQVYGQTLEEMRARYPDVEIMPFDEWSALKSAKQDAGGKWEETTEESYHDMLNVLPPASWVQGEDFGARSGFLVGEAYDHHIKTGRPRFAAFMTEGGKFFAYSRPMTFSEFKGELGETARLCYA